MRKGWQTKKLGEVADVYDGPHATPKTVDTGPIFLGISALRDGVIDLNETRHLTDEDFRQWTRRVKPQPNDVVFSYETRLGQAAIIPDGLECCLGRRMGLVRFDEDQVVPRFFLYQYLSPPFRDYLDSKTVRGATVDRISIREFPSFQIAVPPLPEQQRIVGILDEAFDGLASATANAEQNLRNARALFESHHHSIFSYRRKGWDEKTLGNVCEYVNGKAHEQCIDADGRFIVINSKFISSDGEVIKKSNQALLPLQPGEIAMVLSDVPNGKALAKCFLVESANTYTLNQRICLIRSKNFHTKFLFFQLNRNRHFLAFDNGENQTNLRLNQVLSCPLFLPPAAEQEAIASNLDATFTETQRLESIYQQKLAALGELKKSLLHEAFSGRL